MEEQNIVLVQKPIISHKLKEIGLSVSQRIEELNLPGLIATDETIKALKVLSSELNKEFKGFEEQRKALKKAVANPYMEFETEYNVEITERYKNAAEILKPKIAEFENKIKVEKMANIVSYFNELCADAKIDFLKFENTGLEINLSTSEKQYKEKCTEFVNRAADDILLIQSVDYAAETMAEYKKILNAAKAITTVRERKEAEKLEQQRIKSIETARRVKLLQGLTMVPNDLTRTYVWITDNTIYIELSEVENLSKDEFAKKYIEIETAIKSRNETYTAPVVKPIEKPEVKQVAQPLPAPVEVIPEPAKPVEKLLAASFKVTGTMTELMALKQFLVDNNYKYENL